MENPVMNWRKSSWSNGGGNACIEVASDSGILIRDSTNRDGGTLALSAAAWQAFTSKVKIKKALREAPSGACKPRFARSLCVRPRTPAEGPNEPRRRGAAAAARDPSSALLRALRLLSRSRRFGRNIAA